MYWLKKWDIFKFGKILMRVLDICRKNEDGMLEIEDIKVVNMQKEEKLLRLEYEINSLRNL